MATQAQFTYTESQALPVVTRGADSLSFTSREPIGRIRWWDVTPPKTDYWHAHEMLGRAYALELLDLIQDENREISDHIFGHIATSIVRQGRTIENDGLYIGFFHAISEYLVTGKVKR
jgi:hypothetical protein